MHRVSVPGGIPCGSPRTDPRWDPRWDPTTHPKAGSPVTVGITNTNALEAVRGVSGSDQIQVTVTYASGDWVWSA